MMLKYENAEIFPCQFQIQNSKRMHPKNVCNTYVEFNISLYKRSLHYPTVFMRVRKFWGAVLNQRKRN